MGIFVFWNVLLASKILEFSLCIATISMLILKESACAIGLQDWSKSIPWIWELSFAKWRETNFHSSEQSPSLILGSMSEHSTFSSSGMYLIGFGDKIRLTYLFLSYCTNKAYFRHFLWWSFKPSSMLFGVGGLYGRRTSIFKTTGMTWSNIEQISSIYVLW